jgi:hypothetical protein
MASKNINSKEGKKNWKKLIYPKDIFDANDSKILKDKRRQNYRITCSNYKLINNTLYYGKSKNINKLYRIPYEFEKLKLLEDTHNENGYIGYIRLYKEIKEQKFYWKNMVEDLKSLLKIVLNA